MENQKKHAEQPKQKKKRVPVHSATKKSRRGLQPGQTEKINQRRSSARSRSASPESP